MVRPRVRPITQGNICNFYNFCNFCNLCDLCNFYSFYNFSGPAWSRLSRRAQAMVEKQGRRQCGELDVWVLYGGRTARPLHVSQPVRERTPLKSELGSLPGAGFFLITLLTCPSLWAMAYKLRQLLHCSRQLQKTT